MSNLPINYYASKTEPENPMTSETAKLADCIRLAKGYKDLQQAALGYHKAVVHYQSELAMYDHTNGDKDAEAVGSASQEMDDAERRLLAAIAGV